MADPFEVRMRFSGQLQHLNASVTSAQKAAAYALKFKEMDEDLHSCIIEQLEKPSTTANNKANIMYFIEHFLDLAHKDGHVDYVRMMQRDIIRVVDAVAPGDGTGAANIKVVRKVLHGLQQKDFLQAQTVTEIEEVLQDRDAAAHDIGSSPVGGTADGGDGIELADAPAQPSQTAGPPPGGGVAAGVPIAARLDRKQIEQRLEEDRERHKRLRESIWAVPRGEDAEMWKLFDEASELGDDDRLMGDEELEEWDRCAEQERSEHRHPQTRLHAERRGAPNGRHNH